MEQTNKMFQEILIKLQISRDLTTLRELISYTISALSN